MNIVKKRSQFPEIIRNLSSAGAQYGIWKEGKRLDFFLNRCINFEAYLFSISKKGTFTSGLFGKDQNNGAQTPMRKVYSVNLIMLLNIKTLLAMLINKNSMIIDTCLF